MKHDKNERRNDMRAVYDFSTGVRGKHAAAYRRSRKPILLDQDVARVFKDSREVNDALRALAQLVRQHARRRSK